MMGIIVGVNRLEYIQVKKKDLKKHFFVTRDQLYKFYPDTMSRMILEDKKGVVRTESVIMYPEMSIRPFGWRGDRVYDPFDFDTILANLDDHKRLISRSRLSRARVYLTTTKSVFREIAPILPFVIAGLVLLGAFTGVLQ